MDIKAIVLEIRNTRIPMPQKKLVFESKHSEFAKRYPKLFAFALDDSFDLKYLDFMLAQLKNLEAKTNVTDEVLKEADKIVYEKLSADYVTPVLEKAAKQDS